MAHDDAMGSIGSADPGQMPDDYADSFDEAKPKACDLIEELERTINHLTMEVEELTECSMRSERTRIRVLCDNWRSENEEDASNE